MNDSFKATQEMNWKIGLKIEIILVLVYFSGLGIFVCALFMLLCKSGGDGVFFESVVFVLCKSGGVFFKSVGDDILLFLLMSGDVLLVGLRFRPLGDDCSLSGASSSTKASFLTRFATFSMGKYGLPKSCGLAPSSPRASRSCVVCCLSW